MLTVAAVVDFLDRFAPRQGAADWDNVGLLLGDPAARVQRIMTCLTVTPESAAEAAAAHADLIVTHHPILFRGVKRLTSDSTEGRMVLALARGGVAVYSPHTAFDNAPAGINQLLAQSLELTDLVPLRHRAGRRQCKVVVFVPDADLARVSDALFAAGAGNIGEYGQCSFRLVGTGTFFGSDAANPAVGQKGRREEVAEWRLEVVCPEASVTQVIAAIRRAHSYEEPAYDIYPLFPAPSGAGEGRLGKLPRTMQLGELGQWAKHKLHLGHLQMIGDPGQSVSLVAIACGAGGEFLDDAVRAAADVFLTGELRFHDCLAAQARGLAVLLPGHYATERIGVEDLARRLQQQWQDLRVWTSQQERDPLQFI